MGTMLGVVVTWVRKGHLGCGCLLQKIKWGQQQQAAGGQNMGIEGTGGQFGHGRQLGRGQEAREVHGGTTWVAGCEWTSGGSVSCPRPRFHTGDWPDLIPYRNLRGLGLRFLDWPVGQRLTWLLLSSEASDKCLVSTVWFHSGGASCLHPKPRIH